jgi:competence protein ComEA
VSAPRKVRVNLASEQELLELPGLGPAGAAAIVHFRSHHGPIKDAAHLHSIRRGHPHAEELDGRVDVTPAESTAPEAPGA